MNFFKKLFGGGNRDQPPYTSFEAGDLFYTQEGGKYQFFKVLKVEEALQTLHVLVYEEQNTLPWTPQGNAMPIKIYHAPIDSTGFKNPQLFEKGTVRDSDLVGYFYYIKETHHVSEIVAFAKKYYQEGYELTSQKKEAEAIQKYDFAIQLMPAFFEALDNRAFCKMDLGRWSEAIVDFKQSLQVNPNSLLAVFSMGECYLRMQDYPNAQSCFENAIQINPNHPKPREFLRMTLELMKNS